MTRASGSRALAACVAVVAAACAASCVSAFSAAAAAPDPRLAARLDAVTAGAVWAVAESARAAGLPAEPVVAKALEGAAHRASAARIVAAARRQSAALGGARGALGTGSSESEIVAGAAVLLAGVPADMLARLRAVQPGRSLVIPLVVLGDLVARRVPPTIASAVVVEVTAAGARDAALSQLRQRVERDILAGADPATAARVRAGGLLIQEDGSRMVPGSPPGRGARSPPGVSGP